MFKETKICMYLNKITKDVKLLVFSDIHFSGNGDIKKLEKLLKRIKTYDIDYICIPGDIIDVPNINCDYIINFFTKLGSVAPVILSLGNHDIRIKYQEYKSYYDNEFWNKINNIDNVYLLNNEKKVFENIYFYGFTQSFNYYYEYKNENSKLMKDEIIKNKVCENIPNKISVLLMHSPVCIDDEEIKNEINKYDIVLSGHMHNGIVPPILDEIFDNNVGLIAPNKRIFPKNARGVIKDKNLKVISSGVTKLSKSAGKIFNKLNFLFPIGINYIEISSKNISFKKSIKYYK